MDVESALKRIAIAFPKMRREDRGALIVFAATLPSFSRQEPPPSAPLLIDPPAIDDESTPQ
mgnify:CR=1 FL=1